MDSKVLDYHIYHAGYGQGSKGRMLWNGSFSDIRPKINELLEGRLEHVSVLFNGKRADMFVVEDSAGNLPVNELATKIYHASSLSRNPTADTSSWAKIYGSAVVFDERVWS